MKKIASKKPCDDLKIEHLYNKSKNWIQEIEFMRVEQDFFKELIIDHTLEICNSFNYNDAKFLLKGIEHENKLGEILIQDISEHRVNLALLLDSIFLKKEKQFRGDHEALKIEVINYLENFKFIKKEVFKLILQVMKKEKQQRLLAIK